MEGLIKNKEWRPLRLWNSKFIFIFSVWLYHMMKWNISMFKNIILHLWLNLIYWSNILHIHIYTNGCVHSWLNLPYFINVNIFILISTLPNCFIYFTEKKENVCFLVKGTLNIKQKSYLKIIERYIIRKKKYDRHPGISELFQDILVQWWNEHQNSVRVLSHTILMLLEKSWSLYSWFTGMLSEPNITHIILLCILLCSPRITVNENYLDCGEQIYEASSRKKNILFICSSDQALYYDPIHYTTSKSSCLL